jgi:predicted kinase
VIVQGYLQDANWHSEFFDSLKVEYPQLNIAILHVIAPFEKILRRSAQVSVETGRQIPIERVHMLLDRIPKSVEIVKGDVDFFCTISNEDELKIVTEGQDWDTFRRNFIQTCAYVPGFGKGRLGKLAVTEEEMKEATAAAMKFTPTLVERRHRRRRTFSFLISSEENHRAEVPGKFFGSYSHIRKTLDYSYHAHYTRERQSLQDAVISDMLHSCVITDVDGHTCSTPTEPWIVFSAGAMGSGKTYTLTKLSEKGRFPLKAFIAVDPDEIRRHLPEFYLYVDQAPEVAGELTRKEAGYISEILTLAGLQAGKNVLVDGSLRDHEWYKVYFARLRKDFPLVRQAIIHVTAPREAVFQRAAVSGDGDG